MARSGGLGWSKTFVCATLVALMGPLASCAFGAEGESNIYGDLGQAVAALVIFLVLLGVLGRYAWKPLVVQLQRREQSIADTIAGAQQRQTKAEELLAQYKARLDAVEAEAAELLGKTRQEVLAASEQILNTAREEARKCGESMMQEMDQAKQEALRELYEKSLDLATEIAGKIMRQTLRPEDHRRLLAECLEELPGKIAGEELMGEAAVKMATVMDPALIPLAGEYALALGELLGANDDAEEVSGELAGVLQLMEQVPDFEHLLVRTPLSTTRRMALVREVFQDRASETLVGLLMVLAENGRLGLLPLIARRLRELLDERQGKIEVEVSAAVELDEAVRQQIAAQLRSALGLEPTVRSTVRPELLGGMVVRIGDRVYDDSLATRLVRMRHALSEATGSTGL